MGLVNPYVNTMAGDKNSLSAFRFRIHDPEKYSRVKAFLARLDAHFLFAVSPSVTAIEIALDDVNGGPEQVLDWYRGLTKLASENHRLYRDFKGSGQAIPRHRESVIRKLSDGYQIGIGSKNADCFQHAYFKTNDGPHRARYEIRLQGAGLSNSVFDDWETFRFESLSSWFRFRVPKGDLTTFEQLVIDAQTRIGERKSRNRNGGGIRLHGSDTKADPLNEKAREALRGLSRRWKSPKRGVSRPARTIAAKASLAEIRATQGRETSINTRK